MKPVLILKRASNALVHNPVLLWTTGALVATAVAAGVSAVTAPHWAETFYSEYGPIEGATKPLWILAGLVLVISSRGRSLGAWAGAALCLFAAAREADWHKKFTDESVLKIGFYVHPDDPLESKLIAGAAVLLLIVSVVMAVRALARAVRRDGGGFPIWGGVAAIGFALLIGTKVLDRSRSWLHDVFGVDVGETVKELLIGMEESLEMMLPLVLITAIVMFRSSRVRERASRTIPPVSLPQPTPSP